MSLPDPPISWLVLGDSLSDGMWARDPAGIGSAWPAAASRLAQPLGWELDIVNRSRGGSRSVEVLADLRLGPEAARDRGVCVLVGANDLWRRWVPWEDHDWVDPDDFARNLRRIVALSRDHGALDVVLMTPCLLHADPDHEWNLAMGEYREVVGLVARSEGARLVPSGEDFEASVRAVPSVKWTYDGVHPRPVGHERLAHTWLHHVFGTPSLEASTVPEKPQGHRLGNWP